MSEEIAIQKTKEIKELEKTEAALLEEVKDDKCPCCYSSTSSLLYINPELVRAFGVVECTNCGCWYGPMSIRKNRIKLLQAGLVEKGKSSALLVGE